jgi:PAS domain S-box-containing protein
VAEPVDIHRLVVEHALDLVSVVDDDGRVVYASPSHERVLGHEPGDIVGRRWLDLAHPEDLETARRAMEAVDDATPVVRLRHCDGRWILVEGRANTVPGAGVRLAVWRDVTARTRAERRRDAQYTVTQVLAAARGLPEAADAVLRVAGERLSWELGQIWRVDDEAGMLRRLTLWTDDDLTPEEAEPIAGPDALASGEFLPGRVWQRGEPEWVVDVLADRGRPPGTLHAGIAVPVKVGGRTWGVLEWAARKLRTPDDDRLRVFASFGGQRGLFIVRTEAGRRAPTSRTMLDAVVAGTLDAVFVKDGAGRYLLINESGARALGRPVEEVVGRDDTELMPAELAADIMARDRQVMESGETVTGEERVGERVFLSTKAAYRDERGELLGLIGIAHDVTDHRRLEAELQQAQKMEAVGRLAGGVAHDFNNILSVIRGFSDLARTQLGRTDATVDEWLGHVSRATDQGSALTRQLLAFSRRQPLETELLAVNGVVAEMDALLRRVLGEDLRLVTVFGASPGSVEINRGQLEQVVMNLAVNARDAMPAGGKLTIETADARLDEDAAARLGLDAGSYVALRVADTGVGMDAETAEHIFEPFFTTKSLGGGTGLGLATVYGIVTGNGGHVGVQSAPGAGTTFTIHLPGARRVAAAAQDLPAEPASAAPSGTVLIAEDDEVLRGAIRSMLEQAGYRALTARSGEEALATATAFAGGIDALVTDVIMPGMRGPELAARLRTARPGLRIVFVTGYSDAPLEHELRAGDVLLNKPFGMEALLAALGEALPDRSATR